MSQQRPRFSLKREHGIAMRVNAGERLLIEDRARAVGMSVSAYTRSAVLGRKIRTVGSAEAIDALTKMNGDLIILVRTLRDCLTDARGGDRVEAALGRIETLQERMAMAAAKL